MDILNNIIDTMRSDSLSYHQRIENLYRAHGHSLPVLPPAIVRCKITTTTGKTYRAILEYKKYPYYLKDDGDSDVYFWKVLHTNPKKRHNFNLDEVVNWMFIKK